MMFFGFLVLVAVEILAAVEAIAAGDNGAAFGRSHFVRSGDVYVQSSTQVVSFSINMWPYTTHCTRMRSHLLDMEHHKKVSHECSVTSWRRLQAACRDVDTWPHALFGAPADSNDIGKSRPKRFLGMFATVLSFVGIGAAIADAFAISAVSSRVDEIQSELRDVRKAVAVVANATEKALHTLEQQLNCITLQDVLSDNYEKIATVDTAIVQLMTTQRVSPSLLPLQTLEHVWPLVQQAVRDAGHEAESLAPHVVYEMPASFEVTGHKLHVFVALPLVSKRLRLYTRADFPINTPRGPCVVAGTGHALIAVDESSAEHLVLSEAALASCHRIHRHFFCDVEGWRAGFSTTCVGALFAGDSAAIASRCQLDVYKEAASVVRVNARELAVYLERPGSAIVRCSDGSSSTRRLEDGFSTVALTTNCSLSADHFYVPTHINRDVELGVVAVTTWPQTPAELALAPAFRHDVAAALERMNAHHVAPSGVSTWLHGVATVVAVVAAVAVALTCGALYIRYKCLARRAVPA